MKTRALSRVLTLVMHLGAGMAGLAQVSCNTIKESWEELAVVKSALAAQFPDLKVFIRDEALHDPGRSQPRIYVQNTSSTESLSDFKVHYYFKVENGGTPVLGVYWAPGSQVTMQEVEGGVWRVVYDFTGTTLGPGQIAPDSSGNVIGLNYATYTG